MLLKTLLKVKIVALCTPLIFVTYTQAQSESFLSFENEAVERAYSDETRDLTRGIFLEFEPNDLPNKEEQVVIFKIAKQAGLKGLEVEQFKYVTIWGFDWPYWRFNEEGEAVCEKFRERAHSLWNRCKSNTRIVVWPD